MTCQYDSCEFPLDCPGELTGSFTCVQCSVQYIMICNSMQSPTHPLSPHLTWWICYNSTWQNHLCNYVTAFTQRKHLQLLTLLRSTAKLLNETLGLDTLLHIISFCTDSPVGHLRWQAFSHTLWYSFPLSTAKIIAQCIFSLAALTRGSA